MAKHKAAEAKCVCGQRIVKAHVYGALWKWEHDENARSCGSARPAKVCGVSIGSPVMWTCARVPNHAGPCQSLATLLDWKGK